MIRSGGGAGTRRWLALFKLTRNSRRELMEPRTDMQARNFKPDTAIPRPEYPRPQFMRKQWLNLNGVWEFAFDDSDEGLKLGWQLGAHLNMSIVVPYPYQCRLSGIDDKGIHEVVWYARSFEVPKGWLDGDVLLHFGAVDYRATVWVNGEEVGHNRGGHVPFWFNILPYLREGV